MILPLVQFGVCDSQELIDDSPIKLDVSALLLLLRSKRKQPNFLSPFS